MPSPPPVVASADANAERERYLCEQPSEVLMAHAQELGVVARGARAPLETRELVRRIMSAESAPEREEAPAERGGGPRGPSAQSQEALLADEELARSLQSAEARAAAHEGRAARGAPPELQGIMELLRRAGAERSSERFLAAHSAGEERGAPEQSAAAAALRRASGAGGGGGPGHPAGGADSAAEVQQALALISGLLSSSSAGGAGGRQRQLLELLERLAPSQGIDQSVVDARSATMTFDARRAGAGASEDELKCMVCLEEFQPSEELRILPCMHRYHKACVDQWLKQNRHCPVCKHDMTRVA